MQTTKAELIQVAVELGNALADFGYNQDILTIMGMMTRDECLAHVAHYEALWLKMEASK